MNTLITPALSTRDVSRLLSRLSDVDHAVLTNSPQQVIEQQINLLGWNKYFLAVKGKEKYSKPDPRSMLELLEIVKIRPGRHILMIGDSDSDMMCARDAGCNWLLVGEGRDVSFKSLNQMNSNDFLKLTEVPRTK